MPQLTPPPHLYGQILDEIRYQQRLKQLKRMLFLCGFGLITSVSTLIVVAQDFLNQARQTGFLDFSSLVISDFHLVTSHFFDYILSLAESLPAVSFAFLCLALLIIIISGVKMLSSAVELKHLKVG